MIENMAPYRLTSLYSHTSGHPSFRRSKILRMLLTFRVNAKSTLNQIKPAICQILNCLGSLLTFQAVMLNHTVNFALWISLEPSHVSINMKQTIYLLTVDNTNTLLNDLLCCFCLTVCTTDISNLMWYCNHKAIT